MESTIQDQLKQHLTDNASTMSRYVVGVFLILLSAVGTVGNATVLWVFWARRQQVVATLFIVVLAAVDFSTCVILMPFTVYMELMHFHVQLDAVCKLYQVVFQSPAGTVTSVTSNTKPRRHVVRQFNAVCKINRTLVLHKSYTG